MDVVLLSRSQYATATLCHFPSSLNPAFSFTAFNSSASALTFKIMLVVAFIFVPIVILYQEWGYYLFNDKVSDEHLASDEAY
ncbi:MAG: cytochrome d ubiquinol oxidase subunit II [Desulfomonilaceae bacterium]